MFDVIVAIAIAIALGLIIYTMIFVIGSFILITNSKFLMWVINTITVRCAKISKEFGEMTKSKEE